MKRTTVVFLTMMLLAAAAAQAYSAAPCAGMPPLTNTVVMNAMHDCCAPGTCDCKVKTATQADALSFAWVQSLTGFSMPPEDGGTISSDSVAPVNSSTQFSRSKKVSPKEKIYDLDSSYRI